MLRSIIKSRYLYWLLGTLLFFAAWFITSALVDSGMMIFPNPLVTFSEFFALLGREYTYRCILNSLERTALGFAIAFLLGIALGVIAGNFPKIKETIRPMIGVSKVVPTAALVFLFLVVLGAKDAPIALVVLISFPIIFESVCKGIENVDSQLKNAARVDGAGRLKLITMIELPLIAPYIGVGVASSLSLSFKIEIMSEIISGYTREGIGSAILSVQRSDPTNMTPIFAYSLVAIAVAMLMSALLGLGKMLLSKKYF